MIKDYEPLSFTAHKEIWRSIANLMVDTGLGWSIEHRMRNDDVHIRFFQSEMEAIMYWLDQAAHIDVWRNIKEHFQKQIDEYIKSGEWV